jgi:hypothetical protein
VGQADHQHQARQEIGRLEAVALPIREALLPLPVHLVDEQLARPKPAPNRTGGFKSRRQP